jgi:hypothetical protein
MEREQIITTLTNLNELCNKIISIEKDPFKVLLIKRVVSTTNASILLLENDIPLEVPGLLRTAFEHLVKLAVYHKHPEKYNDPEKFKFFYQEKISDGIKMLSEKLVIYYVLISAFTHPDVFSLALLSALEKNVNWGILDWIIFNTILLNTSILVEVYNDDLNDDLIEELVDLKVIYSNVAHQYIDGLGQFLSEELYNKAPSVLNEIFSRNSKFSMFVGQLFEQGKSKEEVLNKLFEVLNDIAVSAAEYKQKNKT